jgi:CheY-like chemotaxis protein
MNKPPLITFLLIEDDSGHARLIEKNLRRSHILHKIVTITDGKKALNFLDAEGEYTGTHLPYPLIVLLDLNIPVVDGFQVLKYMKDNPKTRSIPVIVLTTTDDAEEIRKCYDLGCNLYITKPVDYEEFSFVIKELANLLKIVKVANGF